jgi:hypothetical protein
MLTWLLGLGCRSAAYLLYGVLSTISWMLLVLSSFLSHYSTTARPRRASNHIAEQTSIYLRRLGKIIACANAVWIIVLCLLQFSNFFSQCYCNSSVLGLGAKAYLVVIMNHDDIAGLTAAWVGGAFLGVGSTILYGVLVSLSIHTYRPQPIATHDSERSNHGESLRILSRSRASPGQYRSTTL